MPLVYSLSLDTAGNLTTSASANTETDAFFLKAGARSTALQSVYVTGKGAALQSMTGLSFRLIKFATASTGGTGITPRPKNPGYTLSGTPPTAASRPTAGATRTNFTAFGCGAGGPGGWVARDNDSLLTLDGSSAGSIDMMDSTSGSVAMAYEFSAEGAEL